MVRKFFNWGRSCFNCTNSLKSANLEYAKNATPSPIEFGVTGDCKRSFPRVLSFIAGLMAAALLASCTDKDKPTGGDNDPLPTLGAANIAVAATDYVAGNFEIISTDDYTVTQNMKPGLHGDLAIKAFGKDVYILERMGKDNVIKYNSHSMRSSRAAVYEKSLGTGLNIHDIVVVNEAKAYISCNNSKNLIVIDPANGAEKKKIDLSGFAPDGQEHPFASSLAVYGNHIYVACQRLDASDPYLSPADAGLIAIIDAMDNDKIAGSISLEKMNPVAVSVFGGKMLAASAGDWMDPTRGGIEIIDLSSNSAAEVLTDGNFSDIIFVSADKAYVAVGKSSADWSQFWTEIMPFNPLTGVIGAKIDGIGDGSGGMAYNEGKLYVGDRSFGSSGVAVVTISTNTVEQTISTGVLPPAGLAVFSAD
jgi:DNA-binding beta-propeller fold protein YncE